MKKVLLSSAAMTFVAGAAMAACPAVTVSDPMGVAAGAFPQQYELAEFQGLADCTLEMSENPDIAALNGRIRGNPDMPDRGRYVRLYVGAPRQSGALCR